MKSLATALDSCAKSYFFDVRGEPTGEWFRSKFKPLMPGDTSLEKTPPSFGPLLLIVFFGIEPFSCLRSKV